MLERQGCRVEARADGRAARANSSKRAPALILLDVMLPYHDGFELVRIVRVRPGWESIPIMMLTFKAMEADIVRAPDSAPSPNSTQSRRR